MFQVPYNKKILKSYKYCGVQKNADMYVLPALAQAEAFVYFVSTRQFQHRRPLAQHMLHTSVT